MFFQIRCTSCGYGSKRRLHPVQWEWDKPCPSCGHTMTLKGD